MNAITLDVKDKKYHGWTDINVVKSMERLASTFSFSASNKYPLKPNQWPIRAGDNCCVKIGANTIITGHVEDIYVNYVIDAHDISVGGREVTGDLVDCCHDGSEKQWNNRTVKQIITDLCDLFDISVVVDSSAQEQTQKKIAKFNAEEGQTVFEMISRVCRQYAILPISYGDGKLTLTKVTQSRKAHDKLILGKNILTGDLSQSYRDRYSEYKVIGQTVCEDSMDVDDAAHPSGKFEDDVIERHRPLTMLSERATNSGQCEEKAKWEARIRAARSNVVTYKIQGWEQSDGTPWDINTLVEVQDSMIGVNETLVISDLVFRLNEKGTTTELTLMRKDAYDLLEERLSSKEVKVFGGKSWTLEGIKGETQQESTPLQKSQRGRT